MNWPNFYCVHHHGELAPIPDLTCEVVNNNGVMELRPPINFLEPQRKCPSCKVKKEIDNNIIQWRKK